MFKTKKPLILKGFGPTFYLLMLLFLKVTKVTKVTMLQLLF